MSELIKELTVEEHLDRHEQIYQHQVAVKDNCYKLARELIKNGDFKLARQLQQRGSTHDVSKFGELEYYGMYSKDEKVKQLAIDNHRYNNSHHLDYHLSVLDMSNVDICEMACDLKTRSSEFGTDIKEYIRKFVESREISLNSKFYKMMIKYLNMILVEKFK